MNLLHDSVEDALVNKKSNTMLVFILFSTEENLVSAQEAGGLKTVT